MFTLDNTVQHYDWGSPTAVHELLGTVPDGRPAAELWLGAHPSAPSLATPALATPAPAPHAPAPHAEAARLDDLVRADPRAALGHRVSAEFGPRLPYLLKVLAAQQALSLQVHPRPHAARAGFNRENREGVAPGSPVRSFHDDQHKPELLVALTRFDALAGFRTPRSALRLLHGLEGRLLDEVRAALRHDRTARGVRAAFTTLVGVRGAARCAQDVAAAVGSVRSRLDAGSPHPLEDATVVQLAEQFPGDPGALVSLLLNRVVLRPGEAIYVPAGEVHAYLSGLGVEVMASSDNVLRAGLTSKHVDEPALVECASFEPRHPASPAVSVRGTRSRLTTYRAPVQEFALALADVEASEPVPWHDSGPRIVLALDGDLALRHGGGTCPLPRGRSLFVTHAAGPVELVGNGRAVGAWVP
ncbi:mannose-6-phosphate isomerase, class I [Xylanimonas oleitrophica]|uniref:mannose-6-phosphate isomerase n=1 Tax=Xylanimonas oleitrophica TaxID=2607479 RepID=A0A2W5X277_9MICO|nr:mannose-6-phosphate isomerase, class I [Xylanimonas oleitrophica]